MPADLERLRQLRRVVEDAPDERFDMELFFQCFDCGTAYCAAGWAAFDPWFRENTPIGDYLYIGDDGDLCLRGGIFVGLASIFGLSLGNASFLFNAASSCGVPKAAVLDNIDRLIAGDPAVEYAGSNEFYEEVY